jgi:hypothetical protein
MGKRPAAPAEVRTPRRTYVSLPLAQLLPAITRPAFRKRSPAAADLMANWEAIVGPRLAEATEPRRLSAGQLTIACAGPMAMELQHAADMLISRINGYAGAAIVQRLRFVQAPVAPARAVLPAERSVPVEVVEGVPGGRLQDALGALRAHVRGERT